MSRGLPWGTDGVISMPVAIESTDVDMADLGGFCFTPDGLRINISHAEREDVIAQGYRPQGGLDAEG